MIVFVDIQNIMVKSTSYTSPQMIPEIQAGITEAANMARSNLSKIAERAERLDDPQGQAQYISFQSVLSYRDVNRTQKRRCLAKNKFNACILAGFMVIIIFIAVIGIAIKTAFG